MEDNIEKKAWCPAIDPNAKEESMMGIIKPGYRQKGLAAPTQEGVKTLFIRR